MTQGSVCHVIACNAGLSARLVVLRSGTTLMLNGGCLFPGQQAIDPLSTRQLSGACAAAAKDAEIGKYVFMYCLRHSFASHLLE